MSEAKLNLPALYNSADEGSTSAQRRFLRTVMLEYLLLFSVSVTGATLGTTEFGPTVMTIMLVVLAGLFVFKVFKKLDQDWYRCRALAESVKTSAWRFTMRAHPFDDAVDVELPKTMFRNLLQDILRTNQHVAQNLHNADADQVTDSMLEIRKLPLVDRISMYVSSRIDDQQQWYSKKSSYNGNALRVWIWVTITIYLAAAVSLNAENFEIGSISLAFDPLIVLVTSSIGWLQMKRHGELIASYNLTAHEIGIIRSKLNSVSTEKDFSEFVNEAELAFSREHTQWTARRDVN